MPGTKELYDALYYDELYTGSYDAFVEKYGTSDGAKKLFNTLSSRGLSHRYGIKSEEQMISEYFPDIKKKSPGGQSAGYSSDSDPMAQIRLRYSGQPQNNTSSENTGNKQSSVPKMEDMQTINAEQMAGFNAMRPEMVQYYKDNPESDPVENLKTIQKRNALINGVVDVAFNEIEKDLSVLRSPESKPDALEKSSLFFDLELGKIRRANKPLSSGEEDVSNLYPLNEKVVADYVRGISAKYGYDETIASAAVERLLNKYKQRSIYVNAIVDADLSMVSKGKPALNTLAMARDNEANDYIDNIQKKYKLEGDKLNSEFNVEASNELSPIKENISAINEYYRNFYQQSISNLQDQLNQKYSKEIQDGRMSPETAQAEMSKELESASQEIYKSISKQLNDEIAPYVKQFEDKKIGLQTKYSARIEQINQSMKQSFDKNIREIAAKYAPDKEYLDEYAKSLGEAFDKEFRIYNDKILKAYNSLPIDKMVDKALKSGSANMLSSIGGFLARYSIDNASPAPVNPNGEYETLGLYLKEAAGRAARRNEMPEIDYPGLSGAMHLDWWVSNMAESLPMMGATMLTGYGLGRLASTAVGMTLGSEVAAETLSTLSGIGTAGFSSWYIENAIFEAGNRYSQSLDEGKSPEIAQIEFDSVLQRDLMTLPLQVLEFLPIFSKSFNFLNKPVASFGTEVFSNYLEEIIQNYSENKAMSETQGFINTKDWNGNPITITDDQLNFLSNFLTPQAQQSGLVGIAMAALPGSLGLINNLIDAESKQRAIDNAIQNAIVSNNPANALGSLEIMRDNNLITKEEFLEGVGLIRINMESMAQVAGAESISDDAKTLIVSKLNEIAKLKATLGNSGTDVQDTFSQAALELIEAKKKEIQKIIDGGVPMYFIYSKGQTIPYVSTPQQIEGAISDPLFMKRILDNDVEIKIHNDPGLEAKFKAAKEKYEQEHTKEKENSIKEENNDDELDTPISRVKKLVSNPKLPPTIPLNIWESEINRSLIDPPEYNPKLPYNFGDYVKDEKNNIGIVMGIRPIGEESGDGVIVAYDNKLMKTIPVEKLVMVQPVKKIKNQDVIDLNNKNKQKRISTVAKKSFLSGFDPENETDYLIQEIGNTRFDPNMFDDMVGDNIRKEDKRIFDNWFIPRNGIRIDSFVQSITNDENSFFYGQEEQEVVQKIVDLIKDNPRGRKYYTIKRKIEKDEENNRINKEAIDAYNEEKYGVTEDVYQEQIGNILEYIDNLTEDQITELNNQISDGILTEEQFYNQYEQQQDTEPEGETEKNPDKTEQQEAVGEFEKELLKEIANAESNLINAKEKYKSKEKEFFTRQEKSNQLFNSNQDPVKTITDLFEGKSSNTSTENIKKALKPYKDMVENAQKNLEELTKPERMQKAKDLDASQAKIDLTTNGKQKTTSKTGDLSGDTKQSTERTDNNRDQLDRDNKDPEPTVLQRAGKNKHLGEGGDREADNLFNGYTVHDAGRRNDPGTSRGDSDSGVILDNYRITEEPVTSFNVKNKFEDNIDAITVLIDLIKSNLPATTKQKDILNKYVGWGGIKVVLNNRDRKWNESDEKLRGHYNKLLNLIDELEQLGYKGVLESIKGSVLNAHYTSLDIIKATYVALNRIGFHGGNVLEPSAGTGKFIGAMPDGMMRNSKITTIEKDLLTGLILDKLYQGSVNHISGYEEVRLPNNYYDLIISNIPFGDYSVFDKYDKNMSPFSKKIHNYFFAKALEQVRPGGIVAFITTTGVLDSPSNKHLREHLREKSELIGAIRLPSSSFVKVANTEVVTDIIFLRKKDPNGNLPVLEHHPFLDTIKVNDGVYINEFFENNPINIIGDIVFGKGLYDNKGYTVVYDKDVFGKTEEEMINSVIQSTFPKSVYNSVTNHVLDDESYSPKTHVSVEDENNVNYGEIFIGKNGIAYLKTQEGENVAIPKTHNINKIKDFIKLREHLKKQYQLESDINSSNSEIENNRKELNNSYDKFVSNHGSLNKNKVLILKDINGHNVLQTEIESKEDGKTKHTKSDIYKQRVIMSRENIESVDNIEDAISLSYNNYGYLDAEYLRKLLSLDSVEDLISKYYGHIFLDSDGISIVPRNEYLSGDVKKKLREARKMATINDIYDKNIEELSNIIPKDIPSSSIDVNLGARWIPNDVYESFFNETFKTHDANVSYSKITDSYTVSFSKTVESTTKYGTERISGDKLSEKYMNGQTPVIFDKIEDKTYVNQKETDAAIDKQQSIADAFELWIWKDSERSNKLGSLYNDKFNNTVKRKHDGSRLIFEGSNKSIVFNPHQKDAIAMLINNNGGIIDHIVGAGKTFVMIAAAIKMKQLGIITKPMIIGLKSTIPHLVSDAKSLYPNAKILVPKETDFSSEKRKQFIAKISNNNWDLIIMSHEQFQKIPHDVELQKETIQNEIKALDIEMSSLYSEGKEASKRLLKGLEKRKQNLNTKLSELSSVKKDIELLNFKQTGIDHLFVDESQMFKNLEYTTRINKVAGLGNKEGSKRSFNLLVAARTLQQLYGDDKGVTFLSGTPISNSLVEMYLLFKYLRPKKMSELGYTSFDSWVKQFAVSSNELEFSVTGAVKQNTRFRRFINVPELAMLYSEITDLRNDSNLKLKKPKIMFGGPQLVVAKQSPFQEEWTNRIVEFANQKQGYRDGRLIGKSSLSDKEQTAAMLMATNISNKLSVDQRLVDKDAPFNPNGKLPLVAQNVADWYFNTQDIKGTQLIFSDIGTPKSNNAVENLKSYLEDQLNISQDDINEIFGEPKEDGKINYPKMPIVKSKVTELLGITDDDFDTILKESTHTEGQFNVYDELRRLLVEKGVPSDEIAYIHSYPSKAAKEKLFKMVNDGDIRVVIGSTQKLGTGVNVQRRIVAMHHVDAQWNPAAMEQRNGRGIRQGNINDEVAIYNYGTEKTLDAYKYQLIATKQKFIDQVKGGVLDYGERSIEEEEGEDIGVSSFVAALSGEPLLFEREKALKKVDKLKRQKKYFDNEVESSKKNISIIENRIPVTEDNIKGIQSDIEKYVKKDSEGKYIVNAIINKVVPRNTKELGEAIIKERIKLSKSPINTSIIIGTINGMNLVATSYNTTKDKSLFQDVGVSMYLDGYMQYPVTVSDNDISQGVAITNTIKKIEDRLNSLKTNLVNDKKNIIKYREVSNQVWPKQKELDESIIKLNDINKKLEEKNKLPDNNNDNNAEESQDLDSKISETINDIEDIAGKSLGDLNTGIGKVSIELGAKLAKLMGLYIAKGVIKLSDFIKSTGLKISDYIKAVWERLTQKPSFKDPSTEQVVSGLSSNAAIFYQDYLWNSFTRNMLYGPNIRDVYGGDFISGGFVGTYIDLMASLRQAIEVADVDILGEMSPVDKDAKKDAKEALIQLYNSVSNLNPNDKDVLTKAKLIIAGELSKSDIDKIKSFNLNSTMSFLQKMRVSFQDDFLRQKQVERAIIDTGKNIPDNQNAYRKRDLKTGKLRDDYDRLYMYLFGHSSTNRARSMFQKGRRFGMFGKTELEKESYFGRLLDAGLTPEELNMYMTAMHAPERNARQRVMETTMLNQKLASFEAQRMVLDADIQTGMLDPDDKTTKARKTFLDNIIDKIRKQLDEVNSRTYGMSDQQAIATILQFDKQDKTNKLKQFADEFRRNVIDTTIDVLESSGYITTDVANNIRSGESWTGVRFENYVPFKIQSSVLMEAGLSDESISYNQLTSPIKGLKGGEYAYFERNNPIEQSITDLMSAYRLSEDNEVRRSLYDLVKANPQSDVWEVVPGQFKVERDSSNGNVLRIVNLTPSEVISNSIPVNVDGKKKYIVFKDKYLRDTWQNTKDGSELSGSGSWKHILDVIRLYTQFKRAVLTQFNIEFIFPNSIRDIQDAFTNAGADFDKARRLMAKNIPLGYAAVVRYQKGRTSSNSKIDAYFQELRETGGMISWIDFVNTERIFTSLDGAIKKAMGDPKAVTIDTFKGIFETIAHMNDIIEVGVRVGVYASARESGLSKERAADISKRATVNFNTHGKATYISNTLYLFSNAAIQGTVGQLSRLRDPRTRSAYMANLLFNATVAFSVMSVLLSLMSDDEKKDLRNKIMDPDYMNKLILFKYGDGEYITVPLSYGIPGLSMGLGQSLAQMVWGVISPGEFFTRVYNFTARVFNPITAGQENKVVASIPTVFQSISEWAINKQINGLPVYKEPLFGSQETLPWLNYDSRTPKWMINFSKWLYDNYKIEVYPNTIEHFYNELTEGTVKSVLDFNKLSEINDNRLSDIPLLRRFILDLNTRNRMRYTLYDMYSKFRSYAEDKEQYRYYMTELKKALKEGVISDDEYSKLSNPYSYKIKDQSAINKFEKEEEDLED